MKVFKQFDMIFKIPTKLIHRTKNYNTMHFFTNHNQLYKIRHLKQPLPYNHLHRKYCLYYFKGDDSDSEGEDIDQKRDIKSIILPNTDDILTIKISECNSLQDIFVLLKNKNDQLNWKHISMALAMIRELQIIYYRICLFEKNLSSDIPAENSFENIVTNIDFLNLLNLIEKHYEFMSIQCLSYSLLCLQKIGVDMHCTTIEKLSQRLNNMLVTIPLEKIDFCVLSRYVVSIASYKNLKSVYNFKNIWPIILKKISYCDSYDDIKHISICLYSFPLFINESNVKNFVNTIEKVLFTKPYNSDKLKCSVKVLKLLNSPYWPTQNVTLIRSLLLGLQDCMQYLTLYDLIQIQMIIMKQYEPYQLFKEINTVTSKWLSKAEIDTDITVLQLLSCIIPSTLASQKNHVESLLRKQFLSRNSSSKLYIGPLFNIIRNLKTADLKICDAYWTNVLNCLIDEQPSLRDNKVLRICNRYMNFNNNLAGTYRNYKFESQMIKWLNKDLNYGVSAIIPSKFSKIFSFLISYPNDTFGYDIPEKMVKKILNNIIQYSIYDFYIISRGLNNAFLNRKKKSSLPMFLDQYVRICTAINKRCIEILNQEPKLNINHLNSIYRGYNHRININDQELFYKILDRYKQYSSEDLSSKIIRELTSNFIKSNWYDTEILDKCLEYYKKNHQYLLAESVEKILSLFFLDGISSESFIEFLPCAAEIINRDKFKMSGLHFMKASLALCYFYSLPASVTDYLFSIEFLEKLDNELNNCYAKATYPLKVRQLLMILNRAVCIDYPELDVPWFHTKYCEEFQSLVSKHTGSFYLDVENKLNQVVGKKGYVKTNIFSPYGYKLDFEVNLKLSKQINGETQSEKLIFLLLNEKNLRKTDNEMRGLVKLKQRHLEILGYKVIWIKKSIWNSMFMTEPQAKLSYLKNLIWPNPKKIS